MSLHKPLLAIIVVLMFCTSLWAQRQFVHPGISHKLSDLDRMKAMVEAGEKPWITTYNQLKNHKKAQHTYAVNVDPALTTVYNNESDGWFINDGTAAYYNALMWYITEDSRHAEKAVEILNTWSGIKRNEMSVPLSSGRIWRVIEAAEIIAHTYDGWAEADIQKFKDMLVYPGYSSTTVPEEAIASNDISFYWRVYQGDPARHGNQGLFCMRTMMAMAIFLDNEIMYDRVVRYLKGQPHRSDDLAYPSGPPITTGPTGGCEYFDEYKLQGFETTVEDYGYNEVISNYIYENGQSQESSRDQAHGLAGVATISVIAEMAWNQGDDLYGHLDNRLLKGLEFYFKYNLTYNNSYPDQPEPWEPSVASGEYIERFDRSGRWKALKINPYLVCSTGEEFRERAKHNLSPVFEMNLGHYRDRLKMSEEDTKWLIRGFENLTKEIGVEGEGVHTDHPGHGGLKFRRVSPGDPIKGIDAAGIPIYGLHTIPTTIEAEHYDYFVTEGQGRTYHDLSAENSGGIYRTDEGVDLEVSSDGGYNITDFETGEYLTYTVSAPGPGTYAIKVRYAAENADGKINFAFDGEDATGNVNLPATGSFDTWMDHEVSAGVYLSAGVHAMKVSATGASSAFKLTSISLEVVSVAEVKNLALSGTATQSTTAYGGEAARAIDGNTNGNYNNNSVSHTSHEDGLKWWQVDLGKDHVISSVVIHNRTGSTSYSELLNNFTVEVIDAAEDTVFTSFHADYPNPSISINIGDLKGRYVRIWKTSAKAITLAEVEVFGYEVQKKGQSISFDPLPEKTLGDAAFDPGAVASSGLTVTYSSSNTAVATIESGKIHLVGSGVTTITASQPGDDAYNAAADVAQVLMVSDPAKTNQTITIEDFGEVHFGDDPIAPVASASSGLSLTFSSSNEQVAIITDGKIELKSAGVTDITARQAGNATYNPATATKTLTVQKIAQTITFEALAPRKTSAEPFDPGATASSGLLVTYSSSNDTVATIVNNEVHIVGVGSTIITAYQVGSNAYQPADPVTQVLQVKKEQVITFEALPV
ncbi:carbohydrate-binding protein, partial [Marinoscillum furvescens]|uniref:carbohydrate-binding protein n=1 Tax=Marinoscillum furvescens TaxID=1026 RepID=UPI000E23BB2C